MAATERHPGSLRRALTAACGLLGVGVGVGAGAARAQEVQATVRSAILSYTEPNRVSAVEGIVDAGVTLADGKTLGAHLVFDTLTGASANGATPAAGVQTFTRPSGRGAYTVAAGETPLDDTFKDTRGALTLSGSLPLNRLTTWGVGLYGSGEHDYTSLGANTLFTRDFNQRNTTLSARAAYFHDTVSPEGGRPDPLASMGSPGGTQPRLPGNGTKTTLDLTAGLTQVLDRQTLVAVNYTHSRVRGYQTDPYKLLSVVDPVTGSPADYLFESRPDARDKDMVYAELVRSLGDDSFHLGFRYYRDGWGVRSRTFEFRFRKHLGSRQYLQPHARVYRQDQADFYRRFLLDGDALPQAASADYRLADMHGLTLGLEYGRTLSSGHTFTARGEFYRQTFPGDGAVAVGDLAGLDLFPTLDAYIFQVGWSFDTGGGGGG